MSKERYNQIVDDAYENYEKEIPPEQVVGNDLNLLRNAMIWKGKTDHLSGYQIYERFNREEFINKCKTDQEFSERWGLKIEEQMLSEERRYNIWFNNNYETGMERFFNPEELPDYDNSYYEPTPKKEIIVTYQNEKIKFYE